MCIRMNEDGRAFAGAAAHCHLNRKNLIVDGALYGWTVMRRERERERERKRGGANDLDECFEND